MTFPVVAGILAGLLSSGCPGCGQGTTAGKHGGVEGPALETQRGVCCGCVRRMCPVASPPIQEALKVGMPVRRWRDLQQGAGHLPWPLVGQPEDEDVQAAPR